MLGRFALVIGSVLFTLLVLELGARLMRGPKWLWKWQNLVLVERDMADTRHGRFAYDAELGFIPTPGFKSADIAYDALSYRIGPALPGDEAAQPPVVALGDSYTHGDDVADGETWPAQLQVILHRPVVNAGVTAYGIDQTVLRAERAVAELKPAAMVIGFIPDDLRRAEMRRVWGTEKPYFTLEGNELKLHDVPVPPSPAPRDTLDWAQWIFGYSVAVDTLLRHKGWQYEWAVDHERVSPRGEGERLACALMQRLAGLAGNAQVPALIVAQYDPYSWQDADFQKEQRRLAAGVLKCATDAGLATVDTFAAYDEAIAANGLRSLYLNHHPSPVGARLIAEQVAAGLAPLLYKERDQRGGRSDDHGNRQQ
jgi:GDSL-like Lipase/Acylhydrolase family